MSGNFRSGRRPPPQKKMRKVRFVEKTAKGKPIKPEELTPEAEWCWDTMISKLEHLGAVDSVMAEMVCELWGSYVKAQRTLIRKPQDPTARIAVIQLSRRWSDIAGELGATPRARKHMLQTDLEEEKEVKDERDPLVKFGIVTA